MYLPATAASLAFYDRGDKQAQKYFSNIAHGNSYSSASSSAPTPKRKPVSEIVDNSKSVVDKLFAAPRLESNSARDSNKDGHQSAQKQHSNSYSLYYGNIRNTESHPDLTYSDISVEKLKQTKWFIKSDFSTNEKLHEYNFRLLSKLTSSGKMENVVDDMISHFLEGSGDDYSNTELTEIVKEHDITKRYMENFSDTFEKYLVQYNGDLESVIHNSTFKETIDQEQGVGGFAYGWSDLFSGLMIAIHGWTECQVDIKSYELKSDGSYSGVLTFTLKDNFGLDAADIETYGFLAGFRSWYILQHSEQYQEKYKPFTTVVEIDYPISGRLEKENENKKQ